jgi:hypothetical protein
MFAGPAQTYSFKFKDLYGQKRMQRGFVMFHQNLPRLIDFVARIRALAKLVLVVKLFAVADFLDFRIGPGPGSGSGSHFADGEGVPDAVQGRVRVRRKSGA